ncbi:hypothetical protein [Streptomyces sp. NPDC057939]|uniref:hypothetical protein n=1 Tax=Streptomyces sp. NPDC057939 TaxID=3346284 RepID=UPI0036E36323
MKTLVRVLTVAAVAAVPFVGLSTIAQAAHQDVTARQSPTGGAEEKTRMDIEEFGKKGAYDHAKQWGDEGDASAGAQGHGGVVEGGF